MSCPSPHRSTRPGAFCIRHSPVRSLTWLALGTFATGTESFMIAALLPGLASDLSVTLTAAGQLVTVFALTYAVSSPALSALTAGIGRRNLLLISMTAFALANFFASTATDFWQLLAARILLAAAAGLYVPSASALAGAIVAPERRGTALAIVNGGNQRCGRAWRAAWRDGRSHVWLAYDFCRSRHHGYRSLSLDFSSAFRAVSTKACRHRAFANASP